MTATAAFRLTTAEFQHDVVDLVGVVVLILNYLRVSFSLVFGGFCGRYLLSSVLQPVADSGLAFLLGAFEVAT